MTRLLDLFSGLSLFTFLFVSSVACASSGARPQAAAANPPAGYPAEWWAPVPESERKGWEILPQDAAPGEVIVSKRTALGAFSNLTAYRIAFDGADYASVEGFWQMIKYPEKDPQDPRRVSKEWANTREEVAAMAGFEAKNAGDAANAILKKLGIKWVSYKGQRFEYKDKGAGSARHYELVYAITKAKVEQHPELTRLLKATAGLNLRMDHEIRADDPPAYQTPAILTRIREELE
jgi:hypothetical protein